jgi:hypothetical protein
LFVRWLLIYPSSDRVDCDLSLSRMLALAAVTSSGLLVAPAFTGGSAAPSSPRTRVAMDAATPQCALISLSGDDPLRVAQVLKKAWMEGGVKRGLKGSVLVGAQARSD